MGYCALPGKIQNLPLNNSLVILPSPLCLSLNPRKQGGEADVNEGSRRALSENAIAGTG